MKHNNLQITYKYRRYVKWKKAKETYLEMETWKKLDLLEFTRGPHQHHQLQQCVGDNSPPNLPLS